ncbi:PAS/PAC sensor signal transduction histidine kinase [Desulfovibrio sp. X2]|uniref:two-component system sensor histidine kinase NtrB n=1 Tax=Desulfovibrio sp. X2 TaxID=941449 RepID=UPI000358E0A2|nr:ATP-binding protein [Desulfovibrio sp. X2]EPR42182.1 PAS/PAC sensor signal transduction histidine kinase [Desulfovibrio sp. X2]
MLPLINSSYFQNLVEGFTNGVLIVNSNGEVYVANTAAAHTLGFELEECTGRTWGELLAGVHYATKLEGFMHDAAAMDRCNLPFFTPYQRPDGQTRYLNLTTTPLVEWHKMFGIMILITDVTSLQLLHQREKAILTENNQLQLERYESLHNISQAIAHQIRNPMLTIGGFAGLLLRRAGSSGEPCRPDLLEGILDASRRLEEIVNAVSHYTSLSLQDPLPTSITRLIEEARALMDEQTGAGEQKLEWDIRVEPAEVVLDVRLFMDAAREILRNALEALSPRPRGAGRIALRGSRNGQTYLLIFSDNGQGIDPAHLPYVTDPFFTTKAVGVGMGLTNVERIVREHKGTLFISSQQGKGTAVSIEMPLDLSVVNVAS